MNWIPEGLDLSAEDAKGMNWTPEELDLTIVDLRQIPLNKAEAGKTINNHFFLTIEGQPVIKAQDAKFGHGRF